MLYFQQASLEYFLPFANFQCHTVNELMALACLIFLAVYAINLDDVKSVIPGCCKEMLRTVRKLDVKVGTFLLLF